tara:strand:+ start:251 stop:475 length:225 start_codon:yes stop_codon:yes gene_type:complete
MTDCDPHPPGSTDVYLQTGRLLSTKVCDERLEEIANEAQKPSQFENFQDLQIYKRQHPIKGFFREIGYTITGKI